MKHFYKFITITLQPPRSNGKTTGS